ncbi:TPA: pyruvate ferredoxin oxidoreductase [bacterium]|nr:pyruvate ferredoxin oxidoreductase [bacterium]
MRVAKTGNEAIAWAMKQIEPDVVAAYPITPATEVVMIFSQYVADGLVKTEYVPAESEHSAMSACIGATAAGARAMTATAAQGLALMWEMLYIASGLRLPIVMAEVNRTLSSPINIHCDHSDTMGARDSGWIQIYSENAQEAYDNTIQAVRVAEGCRLPAMVTIDGFIISHGMEAIDILDDSDVKDFVGEYKPAYTLLDTKNPITLGSIDFTDYYFEHKMQTIDAMNKAMDVIKSVQNEFFQKFGRKYNPVEGYKLEDAEFVIVALGSTCGTIKVVVDSLREEGIKVGLLKIMVFRPFPSSEIRNLLSGKKAIAILDRATGLNADYGPVCLEVRSSLYGIPEPPRVINYIYGLGGRDTTIEHIERVYSDLMSDKKEDVYYLGVRE